MIMVPCVPCWLLSDCWLLFCFDCLSNWSLTLFFKWLTTTYYRPLCGALGWGRMCHFEDLHPHPICDCLWVLTNWKQLACFTGPFGEHCILCICRSAESRPSFKLQSNLTFIPAFSLHPGFSDFSLSTQGDVPDMIEHWKKYWVFYMEKSL
jgi:hypothetical protein